MRETTIAVGNGAKMLSSLKAIVDVFDSKEPMAQQEREIVVYNLAKAALAEPLRNCDVGTAEEQHRRHEAFCDATRNGMSGYHCDNAPWCVFCFSEWAQMPYKEEGGK